MDFRGFLAEMEGFEPPDGLTRQLISSHLECGSGKIR